jgi:hypothetical protein
MGLSVGDKILVFDSDFFINPGTPDYFRMFLYENPFSPDTYIESTEEGRFIIWDGEMGKIALFDPISGMLLGETLHLPNPLEDVTVYKDSLLTLETNGTCRLLHASEFEEEFRFNAYGIKTASLVEDIIVIGKSSSSGFNVPLLSVDLKTKETVPIFDTSMMVFDSMYGPEKDRLYILAVEDTEEEIITVCRALDGPGFEQSQTLDRFTGEDLSASMVYDPENKILFSSLGFKGVHAYPDKGENMYVLEHKEHIPRKLSVHNDYLYAINQDQSITVWKISTRKKVMDFYIFADLNWVALLSNGKYYASNGALEYIAIYTNDMKRLPEYLVRDFKLN